MVQLLNGKYTIQIPRMSCISKIRIFNLRKADSVELTTAERDDGEEAKLSLLYRKRVESGLHELLECVEVTAYAHEVSHGVSP